MYARVASFENRDTSLAHVLVDRVRETARSGDAVPNARGFLMLIDRDRGTSLGISFFDSEDAIREAEPAFERMGDEFPEEVRGRRTSVDVYEVVQREGGEKAKAARVSSLEGSPDSIDESVRHAEQNVLPKVREIKGWNGFLSLADRRSGRLRLITFWDSADALRASEEQADRLRAQAAEGGKQKIVGVDRYEVAVAERLAEVAVG